jgi:hypothetical protein
MIEKDKKNNWANSEILIDLTLFIFPPIGLILLYKSNKVKSKLHLIVLGFAFTLLNISLLIRLLS